MQIIIYQARQCHSRLLFVCWFCYDSTHWSYQAQRFFRLFNDDWSCGVNQSTIVLPSAIMAASLGISTVFYNRRPLVVMCYHVVLDCWCVFVCVWFIFVFSLRDIGRYEAEETDNVGISGSLICNARLWLCFLKEIGSYSSGNMYLFICFYILHGHKSKCWLLLCIYIYIYIYIISEYILNMTEFKQDFEMFSWVNGWKRLIFSKCVCKLKKLC